MHEIRAECCLTIVRLYRNGDVWKESSRLGAKDLRVVRHVLDLAHAYILLDASQ